MKCHLLWEITSKCKRWEQTPNTSSHLDNSSPMLKHMWLTWELVKTWLVDLGWSIRFYTSENSHVLWTPLWNSELSRYLFIFIYLIFLLISCLWNYRLLWILSLVFSHFQHLSFQRQVYTSIYRHTLAQIIVCTHTHTHTNRNQHAHKVMYRFLHMWPELCLCERHPSLNGL